MSIKFEITEERGCLQRHMMDGGYHEKDEHISYYVGVVGCALFHF